MAYPPVDESVRAYNENALRRARKDLPATTTRRATPARGRATQQAAAEIAAPARRNPHPANAAYVSPDGNISYDSRGRQLDSNGNVALYDKESYGDAALGISGVPGVYPGQGLPATAPSPWGTAPGWGQDYQGGIYQGAPVNQLTGQPLYVPPNVQQQTPWLPPEYGTSPLPNPGANVPVWAGLDDAQMQRQLAYWNASMPWAQFGQNSYQYANDFGEGVRRFDRQQGWQERADQMSIAARGQLPNARWLRSYG